MLKSNRRLVDGSIRRVLFTVQTTLFEWESRPPMRDATETTVRQYEPVTLGAGLQISRIDKSRRDKATQRTLHLTHGAPGCCRDKPVKLIFPSLWVSTLQLSLSPNSALRLRSEARNTSPVAPP